MRMSWQLHLSFLALSIVIVLAVYGVFAAGAPGKTKEEHAVFAVFALVALAGEGAVLGLWFTKWHRAASATHRRALMSAEQAAWFQRYIEGR